MERDGGRGQRPIVPRRGQRQAGARHNLRRRRDLPGRLPARPEPRERPDRLAEAHRHGPLPQHPGQGAGFERGPVTLRLSIGINDYPDRRLKLDCAAPDARDIRQAFLTYSRRQFPGGVQARLLLDAQATRANILEGLQWLAGKAKGNDVAVVFYAGHGDSQIEGQFYLVPFDANLRKLGATGVSGESLRKALGDLPCTTMLILDACDSGGFDAKATKTRKTRALPTATDTMLRQMVNDAGLVVMCGAAKGTEAAEENGHGFFTRAIIEGLSGKADVYKKGRVDLIDLQATSSTVSSVVGRRPGAHDLDPLDGAFLPALETLNGEILLMQRIARSLFYVSLISFCSPSSLPAQDQKVPAGFEPLFNGRDLAGWRIEGGELP